MDEIVHVGNARAAQQRRGGALGIVREPRQLVVSEVYDKVARDMGRDLFIGDRPRFAAVGAHDFLHTPFFSGYVTGLGDLESALMPPGGA
jgi:hypothetical protein